MSAIAEWFDESLAARWDALLSANSNEYKPRTMQAQLRTELPGKTYSERLDAFASAFDSALPGSFDEKTEVINRCLGPENAQETGMFTNFYWLLPYSRFIQLNGENDPVAALEAIGELTKRSTGEYAIRPLIESNTELTLDYCSHWANSANFHQRRLASEGLRPRLPWGKKITTFLEDPDPVMDILDRLVSDPSIYVRKSVANHSGDYFRLDAQQACKRVEQWRRLTDPNAIDVVNRIDKRLSKWR